MHEMEALHYLERSVRIFFPVAQMSFLVPGCYDTDPAKGMRNPVYDIVPRSRRYNNSICRSIDDFQLEQQHQQYCCVSERHCCPTTLRRCPTRQPRYPYYPSLDPNSSEFAALSTLAPSPFARGAAKSEAIGRSLGSSNSSKR
jgi:hypothetical protein